MTNHSDTAVSHTPFKENQNSNGPMLFVLQNLKADASKKIIQMNNTHFSQLQEDFFN